jgi:hypothetical protein
MARYPRRDLVHVAISPQQGGCGAAHTRPVTHGVPDPDWALVCPKCETAVDNDPLWAKTRAEVPETPDEVNKRENLKKQKDRNLEEIQTAALARMAGIDTGPVQPASVCKQGHQNVPKARFCSECGIGIGPEEVREAIIRMPEQITGLTNLSLAELRRIAEKQGVNPKQSKKQLVESLS